jgi:hypothetical protein
MEEAQLHKLHAARDARQDANFLHGRTGHTASLRDSTPQQGSTAQ